MDPLDLFPVSTELMDDGIQIAGCNVENLANQFGTPLYLYDQYTLDQAAELYLQALAKYYPGPSGITYAGKAYLCLAMAQWVAQRGLWLDCTGEGEMSIAAAAGMQVQNVVVHGVNKSPRDLLKACQVAGTMVVDNLFELDRLVELHQHQELPALWLRLKPGVEVETHAHTLTGHSESKFGMDLEECRLAARSCREVNLPLNGIHFHLGSQFRHAEPLAQAVDAALRLAALVGFEAEWVLSPGGGWGVAYNEDELPQPNAADYIRTLAEAVTNGCQSLGLTLPRLQLEPGRSLIARAGVAVYRVGAVKRSEALTWVLLDGGLADNPRHALYGVNYSALVVERPRAALEEKVSLAGPYCESGDVISTDLSLAKVSPADLLAVPVSGAYQLSMSSHYNGAMRPAVLWLHEGRAQLIQERETVEDLLRRDRPMEL